MMNDRGFTLLEILVAMTVLSLAVGSTILFIPNLTARTEIRQIEGQLDQLLFNTRTEALKSGSPMSVRLDTTRTRLVSSGSQKPLDLPDGSSLTIDGASTTFDRNTPDSAMILFLADGSSSGGVIGFHLNGLSFKRRVSWITGRIDAEP